VTGSGNTIGFWSVANGQLTQRIEIPTRVLNEGNIDGLAISPDGTLLATSLFNNTMQLRRRADGHEVFAIPYQGPVYSLQFSPDGRTLAFVAGGSLRLHRVADGVLLRELMLAGTSGGANVQSEGLVA
jgi:WD40 repeat protein